MSSRFWPSERRSRNSAPAKTVHVLLIFTRHGLCCASGPSSCKPEVHLVGDVAEVSPASGRAAVIHLEADVRFRLRSTWIALVSCPPMSSTVRVDGKHCVRAQPVAENLAANLLLRKRQALAAIARAHRSRLDDFGASTPPPPPRAVPQPCFLQRLRRRRQSALERAPNCVAKLPCVESRFPLPGWRRRTIHKACRR